MVVKKRATFLSLAAIVSIIFSVLAVASANESDALLRQLSRERPNAFVSDYAGVFSHDERAQLEGFLNGLNRQKSIELAVVTLQSLKGGEINDFANRLFEAWGIGKKERDTGILLITAINEKKIRIETGYGIEPLITDAAAGKILQDAILPFFKQEEYANGLISGAYAIGAKVGYKPGSMPQPQKKTEVSPGRNLLSLLFLFLFVIFAIRHPFLAMLLLSGAMHGRGGSYSSGGFGGGFGGFGGGLSGGGGATRGW